MVSGKLPKGPGLVGNNLINVKNFEYYNDYCQQDPAPLAIFRNKQPEPIGV